MKNLRRIAAMLVVLMLACLVFTACGKEVPDAGSVTVVLEAGETKYTVPLDKVEGNEGLVSVLNYLKTAENVDFTYEDSSYGAFVTAVGDVKQDADNGIYLLFWTSVEADFDVSEYATTKTFEGKTLTSSGVGASSMTMEPGAVIYIGTVQY